MNQVKGIVRRAATFQSLRDLAAKIRQKQTELDELIQAKRVELDELVQSHTADLDKLNANIERMTTQKETLQAELRGSPVRTASSANSVQFGHIRPRQRRQSS